LFSLRPSQRTGGALTSTVSGVSRGGSSSIWIGASRVAPGAIRAIEPVPSIAPP
jgi:hypothetical protein